MPFDENLVLADDTLDWSFGNIVTATYGAAAGNVSTTRNAGGFAVIDLGSAGIGGAVRGMAAVLIIDQAAEAAGDELTVVIQESTTMAFTIPHLLAEFDIIATTRGVILGSETPCTVVRRISPTLRYVRALASCTAADDFHTCWVLLSPYPFRRL
jgi:hypothetical protein